MSPQARTRGNQQRRKPQHKRAPAVDLWRAPAELPETQPIAVAHAPGALLHSLGDPPIHDGAAAADQFSKVIVTAAKMAKATILAFSADLLAPDADD